MLQPELKLLLTAAIELINSGSDRLPGPQDVSGSEFGFSTKRERQAETTWRPADSGRDVTTAE